MVASIRPTLRVETSKEKVVFPRHMEIGQKQEADPTGRSPHEAGAKLDQGKVRPALVLGGFARALWAVSEVGSFGAIKYTENGWVSVPNGKARYEDADLRHWLKDKMGQDKDADSNLTHLAHKAWNALAALDLELRKREGLKTGEELKPTVIRV